MKRISDFEKWNQIVSFALLVILVLDCLVPTARNGWSQNPTLRRRGQLGLGFKLVDALGQLALEKSNEKSLFPGIFKDAAMKNKHLWPEESFHQNITVFILPDLRRTGGSDNLATSNQELSLEDSDAIDFYWRQDIDAEKGQYPALWSPDLQYERDVQLVTEKTLFQSEYANRRFVDRTDPLRDFATSQKEFFTLDPFTNDDVDESKVNVWQLKEQPPVVFEATSSRDHHPTSTSSGFLDGGANDDLDLDWLNSTNSDPLNDVFLQPRHISSQLDHHPAPEHNAAQSGDLNTPPVSMDWESKPPTDENRADPLLFAGYVDPDFDTLPTPDLQLAPSDVACIFGDDQVVRDVAEAQTSKETLLRQSPFAMVDSFPTTSDAKVMQSMGPMFEEGYAIGTEQSEVIIETLPTSVDDQSVNSASWTASAPIRTSLRPHSSFSGSPDLAVSPTWGGDHDYVVETNEDNEYGQFTNTWPDREVKLEPYDDSEEDVKEEEEYSIDEQTRAASERDEVRARQLNLPFTAAEIVKLSQDDYISLTRSRGRFTREQIELIKEIRRHGGNKEAARRSRQRKVQMAKQLEDEVQQLERERNTALMEYKKLLREVEMEEMTMEEMKRKQRR